MHHAHCRFESKPAATARLEARFNRPFLALLCGVGMAMATPAFSADTLQGAAAVLKSLSDAPAAKDATKPLSGAEQFRADLTNFVSRSKSLAPDVAAREWLAFVDRLEKLSGGASFRPDRMDQPPPQFPDVLNVLPSPASWDALGKAIASRPAPSALKDAREFGLRLLGHALNGDREALTKLSSEFEALLLKASKEESMMMLHLYRSLDTALLSWSDDPKAILAGVERELKAAERGRDYGYSSIHLPDLVNIIGEKEATPYLRRALVSKAQNLQIDGKATEQLARKIALEVVNDLKVPRWSLLDSLDALELYEAMDKKFATSAAPKPTNAADALADMESQGFGNDYERQRAKAYYLMALIVKGRTEDATRLAQSAGKDGAELQFETSAVLSLGRAGFTEALDDFLHALLTQKPELPYWESYFSVAAKTGKTQRMLKLARESAAKPELSGEDRGNIRENLYRALLAADELEEGIRELRALLASAPKETPRAPQRFNASSRRTIEWRSHALALARLGHLLNKPEWVNEGLAAATAKSGANPDGGDDFMGAYHQQSLAQLLVQQGRLAQAETILVERLKQAVKQKSRENHYGGMGGSPAFQALASLISLYDEAGRFEDVLILLEQSPHWGIKDLAAAMGSSAGSIDFEFSSGKGTKANRLGLAAARALIHANRKSEALVIVESLLNAAPGDDRSYELLIQLTPDDAMARLDALFARDQFEERPLIWKAELLRRAGKQDEAEKVARQAIAIDPSDGEQGKGDRMRVYAVLAEVRAARGDQKEAEVLRGAVKAIRLSEQADDYMSAGLMTRAVKMYQDSLNFFSDAYCIQSRLAVQLTELGQHALAAKHYEKAFELMPDSFGRVESHCFGCESTFDGSQAQGVAERVFTALVAKNPNKPQIHYLFGYLRNQQGRSKDALPHFRRATELDPDYLNAWSKIEGLSREQRLSTADRDRVAFNILRLDPLGRHSSASLETVTNLRQLWEAVEAAAKFRTPAPTRLLVLPASRDAVEKQERDASQQAPMDRYTRYYGSRGEGSGTPAEVLSRHQLIQAISGLLSGNSGFGF